MAVNDLFGNMPVRVKSRAMSLEKPEELEREWDHLRDMMVSLMLANGQLSKLVLSDVARGKRFTIRPDNTPPDASLSHSTLEMDLERIGSILSQSGMLESRNMNSWRVISASIPCLKIQAAISNIPSPSKKIQFISLGKDPMLSRNASNILFNEVNRLMSMSDFGNTRSGSDVATSERSAPVTSRSDSLNNVMSKNWAKSVNKWPMFYIRIDTGSLQHLDDDDEPFPTTEKSLQEIMDVLEAMIMEFLKQQNMRPRASRQQAKLPDRPQRTMSATRTSSARSKSLSKSSRRSSLREGFDKGLKLPLLQRSQSANFGPHFSNWSRVKAAKQPEYQRADVVGASLVSQNNNVYEESQLPQLLERRRSHSNCSRHFSTHSDLPETLNGDLVPSLRDVEGVKHGESELHPSETPTDELIPWVDSRTGKTHQINTRTGQTVHFKSIHAGPRSNSFLSTLQRHGQSHKPAYASSSRLWVDNLLDAWDNPTFARTEAPVPNLNAEADHLHDPARSHHCHEDIGTLYGAHVAKFKGKLQRQSLAKATIIAQVDRKFILAKLGPTHPPATVEHEPESVLVLIDQHAADERCRVELLFEDMFISPGSLDRHDQVQTVEIDPISFGISATEASRFRTYLKFFMNWGIGYSVIAKEVSEVTVQVTALPTLIAERCRLEPTLIVDLLRREIWTFEEENGKPPGSKRPATNFSMSYDVDNEEFSGDRTHPWVQKMNGCPQSILDLLNSRACRGAIMFNDSLSQAECEALVMRLSKCAFPFQCAHGRPSMIPILDLRLQAGNGALPSDAGILDLEFNENDDNGIEFMEAFRAQYVN